MSLEQKIKSTNEAITAIERNDSLDFEKKILLRKLCTHDDLPIPYEYYKADSGEVMMRVWATVIKEGAQIKCQGEWVLFDKDNRVIDVGRFRHHLAERNGIRLDRI